MYEVSIGAMTNSLTALAKILAKAAAHAEARKIDPAVLVNARLFPDMLPFKTQIQIACDNAKGCAARLAGVAIPSYADDEASFADLQARIAKTLAFMATITPAQLEGSGSRVVTIKVGGKDTDMPGATYLARAALPNFYFHLTTAYNILRHNGVEIGKGDFLNR